MGCLPLDSLVYWAGGHCVNQEGAAWLHNVVEGAPIILAGKHMSLCFIALVSDFNQLLLPFLGQSMSSLLLIQLLRTKHACCLEAAREQGMRCHNKT